MAAVTVATQSSDSRSNPKSVSADHSLRKLSSRNPKMYGLVTVAADGDHLDTGITNIILVAWKGATAVDYCNPTWSAAGRITFNVAGAVTGYVYVW